MERRPSPSVRGPGSEPPRYMPPHDGPASNPSGDAPERAAMPRSGAFSFARRSAEAFEGRRWANVCLRLRFGTDLTSSSQINGAFAQLVEGQNGWIPGRSAAKRKRRQFFVKMDRFWRKTPRSRDAYQSSRSRSAVRTRSTRSTSAWGTCSSGLWARAREPGP